jgi:hypothetical protein
MTVKMMRQVDGQDDASNDGQGDASNDEANDD